jgi:hypothetical protein
VLNGVRGDVLHYCSSFFVVCPEVKIHAIEAQKCTNRQQCLALISILESVGLRNSSGTVCGQRVQRSLPSAI